MPLLGILFGGWPPNPPSPPPPASPPPQDPPPPPPPGETGSGTGTGSTDGGSGSSGGGTSGAGSGGTPGAGGATGTGGTTGSGGTAGAGASGNTTAPSGSVAQAGTPVTAPAVRFDFGEAPPESEDIRARAYAIESLARERVASLIEKLGKTSASAQLSLLGEPGEPKEAGGTYADSLKAVGRQGEPVGATLDKVA
jgi:hypothetical protein